MRSLPREHAVLVERGVLRPEDQAEPRMKCARCGAETTLAMSGTPEQRRKSPGVCGRDVAVVCPCCSAGCTHKVQVQEQNPDAREEEIRAWAEATRKKFGW
jgi:hypothetical protein